jgi:predicted DNA-binding protein (UPF0251 family)
MNKIDLIIDALDVSKSLFYDQIKLQEALAAARELKTINAELLEALKHCRQKMAHMIAHGEWYTPETAIDLADAAIAKVEEQA